MFHDPRAARLPARPVQRREAPPVAEDWPALAPVLPSAPSIERLLDLLEEVGLPRKGDRRG